MAICSIRGCSSSQKKKEPDVKFHRFPENEEFQNKWIKLCDQLDPINIKNARVCSLHFEPTAYKRHLKYELLNLPIPRHLHVLNDDALPTQRLSTLQSEADVTTIIMNRESCVNHPDNFCYICGKYTVHSQRKNLSISVKIAYRYYFGCEVQDQDKNWVPHVCCARCNSGLLQWLRGKKKGMRFAVPVLWHEPVNHPFDCYFCLTKIDYFSENNLPKIVYPDCKSALKPVPHNSGFPIPVPPPAASVAGSDNSGEYSDADISGEYNNSSISGDYNNAGISGEYNNASITRECNIASISGKYNNASMDSTAECSDAKENICDGLHKFESQEKKPHLLNRKELSDLVKELSLSKEKAELLSSRMQQWNLLQEDAVTEELVSRVDIKVEDMKPETEEPFPAPENREFSPTPDTESFSTPDYVCKVCGRTFQKRCHLGMHMYMHSSKKKRQYICGVCGEHLACRHKLIEHRKRHTGTVERTSAVSDENNVSVSRYGEHIVHDRCNKCVDPKVGSTDDHQCEFCGKQFRHRNSMIKHRRIHTGDGMCTCDVCGKKFNQKGNLLRHMKIHTNEKDFECPVCLRFFRQKRHLKNHLNIHRKNSIASR